METRKLYYEDPFQKGFATTVVSCDEVKGGYAVVLAETAFYPERDPFIIRRTPAAIPVASTQIPITRLDTADDPIALYIFSFIKTNLLKLTKFNILIHSYFNTTSVDIATWICYS